VNPLILPDRLAKLDDLVLKHGSHTDPEDGLCAREAVAWLAGEPHSFEPECQCPAIGAMVMYFNDRCRDDERRTHILKPLIPLMVGTRSTKKIENRRKWSGADWSIRVATPKLIRLTSMAEWADKLEALPEIVDDTTLVDARSVTFAMRDAAYAKQNEAWGRIRAVAADAAAADAAAAYAAVAAYADVAAAAYADVAAAADAAAADAAYAADAAADAAAADAAAADYKLIYQAARKSKDAGGSWNDQYYAARKVADQVMPKHVSRPFLAMRDELDLEFQSLIRRLCAMSEAA
jgi:hypothetical protein